MGLFDGIQARGGVSEEVGDRAWVGALLEVEAALAKVQAGEGLIPAEHAEEIARACRVERIDVAELSEKAAGPGNPVLPLVEMLRAGVPSEVAASVHLGATSQDILDTAGMLVAKRALGVLLDDIAAAAEASARLAQQYRATPMAGRTLLQLALPVTFGMTAAGWMVALDEAAARLRQVRRERLAVQVGGAVGRLAAYQEKLALELGLAAPLLPWHTNRLRIADLAGALGGAAGVIGKVARDVTLLAQSEVGEVSEAAPGGSSAMAHKRNPVAAIVAVACAAQTPGLVATLLAAMVQEHGRAAGAWHAEWRAQRELLIATGSAAAWLRTSLEGLRPNEDAMAANLALLGNADIAGAIDAAEVFVERALQAHDRAEGP